VLASPSLPARPSTTTSPRAPEPACRHVSTGNAHCVSRSDGVGSVRAARSEGPGRDGEWLWNKAADGGLVRRSIRLDRWAVVPLRGQKHPRDSPSVVRDALWSLVGALPPR
jgi:hypothetical protein